MFDYYYYIQDYSFVPIGMKYLINIANQLLVKPYDIFNSRTEANSKYYFGIFPINCNLLVTGSAIYFYTEKNNFYQNILTPMPNDRGYNMHVLYNINHTYACLYYISIFEFSNKYGITLGNNTSQNFSFNKNLKKLHFSYPNTNINEVVNITIKLLNESNYNVSLYLNDEHINEYYINRNKHILIKPETLKNNCHNYAHICQVFLSIESESENYTIIIIEINYNGVENIIMHGYDNSKTDSDQLTSDEIDSSDESDSTEEELDTSEDETSNSDIPYNTDDNNIPSSNKSSKNNNRKKIIKFLLIGLGVLLMIVFLILIICLIIKKYCHYKDLNEEVNKTSFGIKKETHEENADLLIS